MWCRSPVRSGGCLLYVARMEDGECTKVSTHGNEWQEQVSPTKQQSPFVRKCFVAVMALYSQRRSLHFFLQERVYIQQRGKETASRLLRVEDRSHPPVGVYRLRCPVLVPGRAASGPSGVAGRSTWWRGEKDKLCGSALGKQFNSSFPFKPSLQALPLGADPKAGSGKQEAAGDEEGVVSLRMGDRGKHSALSNLRSTGIQLTHREWRRRRSSRVGGDRRTLGRDGVCPESAER